MTHAIENQRGTSVPFGFGMRSAALVGALLAAVLCGCGTRNADLGSRLHANLVESGTPAARSPEPRTDPEPTPDTPATAAAVAAESRAEASPADRPGAGDNVAPAGAFVPVAVEAVSAEPFSSLLIAQAPSPSTPPAAGTQSEIPTAPPPDAPVAEYDPWERYNTKMFDFNYHVDRYVLKPVAKGYNFVMPDLFQQMIANGFDNINVVPKLANNLLQGQWKGFFVELGRFLINSTLGIGGLFDIARQEFGLEKTQVDFGQTLGKWGLGPGPYLIVPFLPPLTVRDGIGYGVDLALDPMTYLLPFIWDRLSMRIGDIINDRSLNLDLFQGIEESTVDLYSAARNAYLQKRENLIRGTR
ncbi:MAG TPA: MlaA family lipoprotein [Candidatus Methylomirabilis sp.]|nr:MlaA family lipoprotein [Candidatus Methylomirabilis sp.]